MRSRIESVWTSVSSTSKELDESFIPQHLQLLSHLFPYVSIAGIEALHAPLESIDVGDVEVGATDIFDTFHDFDQPPARHKPGIA